MQFPKFPSRVKISSGVLGRVCYDVLKRQVELQQPRRKREQCWLSSILTLLLDDRSK